MANGILDTFEVHNRTPDDVQTWIVRESNAFHKGNECTVVEVYEQCPLAQAKWKAYADPIHRTKNACPTKGEFTYEKQYGRFVGKHFGHYFKEGNWQKGIPIDQDNNPGLFKFSVLMAFAPSKRKKS